MQTSHLHAKFTGDSNSLVTATKRAAFEANKLREIQSAQEKQQEKTAKSYITSSAALKKLKNEVDPIYAATQRFAAAEKTLNAQLAAGKIGLDDHARLLELTQKRYLSAAGAADTFNTEIRANRFAVGNLAAQLNDIGVMLAAGQSPLILAVQQGTQVSQVFNMMGNGRVILASLKAAFLQFLNPVSLVTVGVIAGGAALFQWGMRALGAKENTEEFEKILTSLIDTTKNAANELDRVKGGFATVEELLVSRQINELLAQRATLMNEIRNGAARSAGAKRVEVAALDEEIDKLRGVLSSAADIREEERLRKMNLMDQATIYKQYADSRQQYETDLTAAYADQAAFVDEMIESQELASKLSKKEIAELNNKVTLAAAIKQYGEGSVEVAIARLTVERQLYQQYLQTLDVTEKEQTAMQAAWDAANGIASVDMAGNIDLAAASAMRLKAALDAAMASMPITADMKEEDAAMGQSVLGTDETRGDRVRAGYNFRRLQDLAIKKAGKGGGGKTSEADKTREETKNKLEALQERFMSETELQLNKYATDQELLKTALENKLLTEEEYYALMQKAKETHDKKMTELDVWRYGSTLGKTQEFFGQMATAFASGNEKMLQISKAFGAAEALVNAWRTYSQVMADPKLPWFAKIPAAVSLLGSAMGAVSAIKGVGKGGTGATSAGGGASSSVAATASSSSGGSQAGTYYNVTLTGGDNARFSGADVRRLMESIGDEIAGGSVIRGLSVNA